MSSIDKRVLRRLKFIRWSIGYVPTSIMQILNRFAANRLILSEDVIHEKVMIDGVECHTIIPLDNEIDTTMLYLHGGGFILGMSVLHLKMLGFLAKKMNTRIFAVEYRLAPKYPFPAALDDCITVYRYLTREVVSSKNIVIAGDSAGGNLTISTLMKLRDDGDDLPAAAACLSPAINLAHRHDSIIDDLVIHPRAALKFDHSYVANNDPENPLISPINGNWEDLPPLLIHAGENELLRSDAEKILDLTKGTNTQVEVKIFPRMFHVWQIYPELPETRTSLQEITVFLLSHMEHNKM